MAYAAGAACRFAAASLERVRHASAHVSPDWALACHNGLRANALIDTS
jgi:hypothetical protein